MKAPLFNAKGTRQIVNTGFKRFDAQTNCISTGNVLANTQMSIFIRPYAQTQCNGFDFPEGHLMDVDLKMFGRYSIPSDIEKEIRNKKRKDSVILYMFFTRVKGNIKPFCWILSDRNHKHIKSRIINNGRYVNKMWMALLEIRKYITD